MLAPPLNNARGLHHHYLTSVIIIGFLEVCLACHWDGGVWDVVCLQHGLQDLAGTQRVHVEGTQQQHMLCHGNQWLANLASKLFQPHLSRNELVEIFSYSVHDPHLTDSQSQYSSAAVA